MSNFGLSRVLAYPETKELKQDGFGTLYYRPPEAFRNQKFDFSSEIWALGCTIHETATGNKTFAGPSDLIHSQYPIRLSHTYNRQLRYIVYHLLMKDRDSRPTLDWIQTQLLRVKPTKEKQMIPQQDKKSPEPKILDFFDIESTQDESFIYDPPAPNCEPATTHLTTGLHPTIPFSLYTGQLYYSDAFVPSI